MIRKATGAFKFIKQNNNIKSLLIPGYGIFKYSKKQIKDKKVLTLGIINLSLLLLIIALTIFLIVSSGQNAKRKVVNEKYFPVKTAVKLKEDYNLSDIHCKVSLPTEVYENIKETTLLKTETGYIAITTSNSLKNESIEKQDEELDELFRKNISKKYKVLEIKPEKDSFGTVSGIVLYQKNGRFNIKGKGDCYFISYFLQINENTACKITGFVDNPLAANGKKDDITSTVDSIAKSLEYSE